MGRAGGGVRTFDLQRAALDGGCGLLAPRWVAGLGGRAPAGPRRAPSGLPAGPRRELHFPRREVLTREVLHDQVVGLGVLVYIIQPHRVGVALGGRGAGRAGARSRVGGGVRAGVGHVTGPPRAAAARPASAPALQKPLAAPSQPLGPHLQQARRADLPQHAPPLRRAPLWQLADGLDGDGLVRVLVRRGEHLAGARSSRGGRARIFDSLPAAAASAPHPGRQAGPLWLGPSRPWPPLAAPGRHPAAPPPPQARTLQLAPYDTRVARTYLSLGGGGSARRGRPALNRCLARAPAGGAARAARGAQPPRAAAPRRSCCAPRPRPPLRRRT
jgi:hypothetical protein